MTNRKRILGILGIAIILLCLLALYVCTGRGNQATAQADTERVPCIIFDTDIGSSTDDLFALEILHRMEDEGRCKLLGVVVDREGEEYAACADVMNTYFGHGNVPLGLVKDGVDTPKVWIDYRALPAYKNADGTTMFKRTLTDYSTLPDGWQLYRQLLASQPDSSVSICSVGFLTCLAQLLESDSDTISPLSGVELVRKKVRCLYVMGGVFGDAVEPDYNFGQAASFSTTFFRLWPKEVDIVFTPGEAGDPIEYVTDSVISDIAWTDIHPIKQIYLNCDCNTGQKMWDVLPVLNLIEGNRRAKLSERGTVTYTADSITAFTATKTGNCRYQIPGDRKWVTSILNTIREYNKRH